MAPTDAEVDRLLDDYRAVSSGEREGDLAEIAQAIRERQAKLLEEEGHTGIG